MNMLTEIQRFVTRERDDPRRRICIFGYYPYFGFRRMEFERTVRHVGLGRISRKRISLKDIAGRLFYPNGSRGECAQVAVINGNDKVLTPENGTYVMSYYSDLQSDVKLESIRLLSHILACFLVPFFFVQLRPNLSFREQLLYLGDAIYFTRIKRLLRQIAPQKIELTVSYSHYPVIAAAKSLGIPVTELQHGAISYCHIGYSGMINIYFPDNLVPLDSMWEEYLEKNPLPLDPIRVNAQWVDTLPAIDYQTFVKMHKADRILVIGQETVHSELHSLYARLASDSLDVVYRNHPRVKLETIPLEQQLADADIVIGSYSTILATASSNKKVLIANIPGSEFLDILKDHPNVKVLTTD